ncbi:MFS transporter [Nonomuraea sp. KC401]|uniref:MFS transporter n=1 Tax=unclassified Nonomuraea TaxID=2593643 RepID=UPI0010FD52D8|nr:MULTISPECIES: MFS transporter [unclassified Nonomuraea]NBE95286.1 MFS transporter [Nonomuraea sp. K271]TLF72384.1 MFS transporter [Nonomuraea sp. KC401]
MTKRLLIGRCLSALATALIPTTLTLAVLRITDDGGALGIVLASEMVPLLLLLPVGGVLADRIRPELVALLSDLVRCLAQALIALELLLGVHRLLDLAVLSAVSGAAISFGSPAVPRMVVAAVRPEERLRMNTRIGVATSLSAVTAPALAGTITVAAGPGWAAALTAVVFGCSALTLSGIRTRAPDRGEQEAASSFGRDVAEGWREIRARPWFLACVLGHGVWHLVAGVFLTIGPVMAVRELGGEASWALIVQSGTVGMVLGVFAAPRLPIRRPLAVVQAGAACYLLPMVALAAGAPLWAMASAYFVAMFALGLLSPLWETVVADEVPEYALGRVRSFDHLISYAARPFGLAVAAPLAAVAGVTALALTGGALVCAANLAAILLLGKPSKASPDPSPR